MWKSVLRFTFVYLCLVLLAYAFKAHAANDLPKNRHLETDRGVK
jgi:hypothetical protein